MSGWKTDASRRATNGESAEVVTVTLTRAEVEEAFAQLRPTLPPARGTVIIRPGRIRVEGVPLPSLAFVRAVLDDLGEKLARRPGRPRKSAAASIVVNSEAGGT